MAGPEKKYGDLLKDKDIKRWYRELSRSSLITADTYLRRLGSFCSYVRRDPHQLLSLKDKDLTDLISDEISEMEGRGLSGAYILSTVKAVKSWLAHNNRKPSRKIKVKDADRSVTLQNERVPTQEELKKIFASGDPRARATCALMAHAGLRPEVIGSYMGSDGLKISDFPELEISDGKFEFKKIPAMIRVRPSISKAKHQYITFLGSEGCFYLRAYLEERANEGEEITEDSPIVVPAKLALRGGSSFIRTINIGDIVRQAIRRAGLPWRPYVLRAYFDTQLMMAESKGLIMRDFRAFFMGHKGDIENRYTTNKHRLPEDVIENMRSSYAKSAKFLETESKGISEEDSLRISRESTITAIEIYADVKISDEEREKLYGLSTEEFQNRLREISKQSRLDQMNNGNHHKTISEGDLESYLNKGWELVQIYPKGDKAVVKLP